MLRNYPAAFHFLPFFLSLSGAPQLFYLAANGFFLNASSMNIVIAADAFKLSLSSFGVCEAIKEGLLPASLNFSNPSLPCLTAAMDWLK
jgi:hypothetical protein